jgi:predicted membrane channel-forming protein YqfA (hemolysin III family)
MKRRLEQWMLVMIAAAIVSCIFGAFLGAEKVWGFFDSIPLSLRRLGWFIPLIWGTLAARNLHTHPMLFLIHLGCIFVLSGGILGVMPSILPLYLVFAGYILLTLGLFGYFALEIKRQKVKGKNG